MATPELHTPKAEMPAGDVTPAGFSPENRLTTKVAAAYLGIQPETLARWRSGQGGQPKFYRAGGKIFYLKQDLDLFLESCLDVAQATGQAQAGRRCAGC